MTKAEKQKIVDIVYHVVMYVVLTALAIVLMMPYLFMFFRSLMTWRETELVPVIFFPRGFHWENYATVLSSGNYLTYIKNSLIIALFNTFFIPLSTSLIAYGFAKTELFYKKQLFAIMLATVMLPGVVIQIPLYVMYADFHWLGTKLPLMIPSLFGGGAINVFLVRQFMRGIPIELENAAKIDGANAFVRYCYITLPLCSSIMIFLAVNTFIGCWGDFYGALVYLTDEKEYTLAIGIYNQSIYGGYDGGKTNHIMAAGVVMSLVPMLLFFGFQKHLIRGIAIGGIKG